MSGLLDVASVTDPAESWGAGFQIDSIGGALRSYSTDICTPDRQLLSGVEDETAGANDANIFAIVTALEGRVRCASGSEPDLVRNAMAAETEKAAGKALWGDSGSPNPVSLHGTDVETVTAGANASDSVGAAIEKFWSIATGIANDGMIIHLGISRLLELFGQVEDGAIKNLDIKVATSAGYPADAIAVTGPIAIRLGEIQTISAVDFRTNGGISEATRVAALEFDPRIAVRVA